MAPDEIRQVADWLVKHGFTVLVDYENQQIVIRLDG